MKKPALVLLSVIFFSCQTSKIIHSWTSRDAFPKQYKKILVLGVMKDNDLVLQKKMENHLAGDLKDLGYNAIAASQVFPPGTFIKGDTARAAEAIKNKNFDAVLTIVLLNKVKERFYVPGRVVYTPYSVYYNRFDRYYNTMYDRINTEGYYATETKIFWESNFYDVSNTKMIYSAQTRSFDPGSKESLSHNYGLLITENMVKKNILIKPSEPE